MKKTLFVGLVAVCFSAMFASCSKTRTCECTVSYNVMGFSYSHTISGEHDGSCSELEKSPSGEIAKAAEALGDMGSMTFSCHEK